MTSRRTAMLTLALYAVALGVWKFYVPQTDWLWRAFAELRFAGLDWWTITVFLGQCAVRTLPYVVLGALCVPVIVLPWRADRDTAVDARGAARRWRVVIDACLALLLALVLIGVLRGFAHGALWSAPGLWLGLGCVCWAR